MPKKESGPAFPHSQSWNIKNSVIELRNRALSHLRHGVTAVDIFDAFVKDKDKEPIKRVMKICDVNVQHQTLNWSTACQVEANGVKVDAHAEFNIALKETAKFKFLFPKYMATGKMVRMTPRFAEMVELLTSIHFEWAQVHQVYDFMNDACTTPRQVATILPWLGTMVMEAKDPKELGLKIKNYSYTIDTPNVGEKARDFALCLDRTIAKAQITPETSEQDEDEVSITLTSMSTDAQRWDGNRWRMMAHQ